MGSSATTPHGSSSAAGMPPPVPLLDVHRSQAELREPILQAIARVVDSGRYLHGPDVTALEETIAGLCGVPHAIGCASGSDALLLALMALDVGPGDEVITPSFTFFATASAVWRLGARVVFVDIEPESFNMDPAQFEAAITPATKAVIPVHLFGRCAPMDSLCEIARRHHIRVIEDAAQAIGAQYADRSAGAWGDLGCFSFYPTKNLGGFGDGGMVTACDEGLARRVRMLAAHGMQPRYYHHEVGINSRLDSIQAAVLRVKCVKLAQWSAERRRNAVRYDALFRAAGLEGKLQLPTAPPDYFHVWNQYTIRIPDGQRDAVRRHLADAGIGSEIYYPLPLHRQECFRTLNYGEGSLPHTELAASEVLSLPIFPGLTPAEQERVVRGLASFYGRKRQAA